MSGETSHPAQASPARRRVLVVDPDEGIRAFTAEALNSFRPGFDVATARDPAEAGEWLDTFVPDLLLLGFDPLNEAAEGRAMILVNDPRLDCCKVLMLCDASPASQGGRAPGGHATEFLSRPPDLSALLETVRRLA